MVNFIRTWTNLKLTYSRDRRSENISWNWHTAGIIIATALVIQCRLTTDKHKPDTTGIFLICPFALISAHLGSRYFLRYTTELSASVFPTLTAYVYMSWDCFENFVFPICKQNLVHISISRASIFSNFCQRDFFLQHCFFVHTESEHVSTFDCFSYLLLCRPAPQFVDVWVELIVYKNNLLGRKRFTTLYTLK